MRDGKFNYALLTCYVTVISFLIPKDYTAVNQIVAFCLPLLACLFFYLFIVECFEKPPTVEQNIKEGRFSIGNGWYLERDYDPESKYYNNWFLVNPYDTYVAHFWDYQEGWDGYEKEVELVARAIKAC